MWCLEVIKKMNEPKPQTPKKEEPPKDGGQESKS